MKKNKNTSIEKVRELAEVAKNTLMDTFGDFDQYVKLPWTYDEYVESMSQVQKKKKTKVGRRSGASRSNNYAQVVKRSNNIIPERASETVEAVKKQHKESKKMIGQCRRHLNSVDDDVTTLDLKFQDMTKVVMTLQKDNQTLRNRLSNLEKRSQNMKHTIDDQDTIISELRIRNQDLTQLTSKLHSEVKRHDKDINRIDYKLDQVISSIDLNRDFYKNLQNKIEEQKVQIDQMNESLRSQAKSSESLHLNLKGLADSVSLVEQGLADEIDIRDHQTRSDVAEGIRNGMQELYSEIREDRQVTLEHFGSMLDDYMKSQFKNKEEKLMSYIRQKEQNIITQMCQSPEFIEKVEHQYLEFRRNNSQFIESVHEKVKLIEPNRTKLTCKGCMKTLNKKVHFGDLCRHIHECHPNLSTCPHCSMQMKKYSVGQHMLNECEAFQSFDENSLIISNPSYYNQVMSELL